MSGIMVTCVPGDYQLPISQGKGQGKGRAGQGKRKDKGRGKLGRGAGQCRAQEGTPFCASESSEVLLDIDPS